MAIIELVQIVNCKQQARSRIAFAACAFATSLLPIAGTRPVAAADRENDSRIVIRPANFDPADELAYTRQRGELDAGASAAGKIWNKSVDSQAVVSGEAPAPADAAGSRVPVPAASGAPTPRIDRKSTRLNSS